jgi:hypothetical protein
MSITVKGSLRNSTDPMSLSSREIGLSQGLEWRRQCKKDRHS